MSRLYRMIANRKASGSALVSTISTSLFSLVLAQGGFYGEAIRGRRFIFLLLSVLLILGIVYMVKRIMSK